MTRPLGVGIVGTGWIADVHARAMKLVQDTRLVAVSSRSQQRASAFASQHGVDQAYDQVQALVDDPAVDVVLVCVPNSLHHEVTLLAAAAGKHVLCEKPLAVNRTQAREMIDACSTAGVLLGVAEELCFVPKFVKAKQLIDDGALGDVFQVRQREEHDGPEDSPWFFDRELAGGGALLDMGCHSIELTRWTLGRPPVTSVYAHLANRLHPQTDMDDEVTMLLTFADGATATLHAGWSLRGGMDSQIDIMGTEGVLHVDLLKDNGMRMFSRVGVPDNPDETKHWTAPDPDWLWNNGYPQQLSDFARCVRENASPRVTGTDGLAQLEIMCAAYASASAGRAIELPSNLPEVHRAVDLWKREPSKR